MAEIYCKAGRVELTKEEAFKIWNDRKYVVSYSGIFQPHFAQNQPKQQIYFTQISQVKGIARRGRFYTMTGDEINHVLGFEYLRNL